MTINDSVLQLVAVSCSVLHAVCCNVLQCIAAVSLLQCVACSVLQYIAVYCCCIFVIPFPHRSTEFQEFVARLQTEPLCAKINTATRCNTLQHSIPMAGLQKEACRDVATDESL